MTTIFLAVTLLAQQGEAKVRVQKAPASASEVPAPAPIEVPAAGFAGIRRVYVERFIGGTGAEHLREMLISSLQSSKLFIVTEQQENADAVLKGSAEAEAYKDVHITTDHDNVRQNSSRSKLTSTAGRFSTRDQESASNDMSIGEGSSSHIEERKHEASAAVRLVLKNGDVVWSTTQESLGAKFRGASADVADKIARQLTLDWKRAGQPGGS